VSDQSDSLVIFRTGPMRFGLDVDLVQRVIAACEISPLPGAPAAVNGIVTLAGDIIAVVDPILAFFPDQASELSMASRFLLVRTPLRTLALIADTVDGIQARPTGAATAAPLPASVAQLKEIAAAPDGLIYISDPEGLLSQSDELRLSAAIGEFSRGP
jgi:purine-binding chemotaxis protein CheW